MSLRDTDCENGGNVWLLPGRVRHQSSAFSWRANFTLTKRLPTGCMETRLWLYWTCRLLRLGGSSNTLFYRIRGFLAVPIPFKLQRLSRFASVGLAPINQLLAPVQWFYVWFGACWKVRDNTGDEFIDYTRPGLGDIVLDDYWDSRIGLGHVSRISNLPNQLVTVWYWRHCRTRHGHQFGSHYLNFVMSLGFDYTNCSFIKWILKHKATNPN